MRISQIVYKVDNLEKAVKNAQEDGYLVEYGQEKRPYNAFIYFPEGPYIEYMKSTGVPGFVKFFMRLFRCRELAQRFKVWDEASEGPIGIGIEVDSEQIDDIRLFLTNKNIKSFKIPISRVDIHGKNNICYCLFPANTNMPFYVTKYLGEKSRDHYIHKNGVKQVQSVEIRMKSKEYAVVHELFTEFNLWQDLGGVIKEGTKDFDFDIQLNKGDI